MMVRDAIHGGIELNELEEKILDSLEMQRLRGIKQLAMAYLVYPSANHSRFEHSLGTFHLTSKLCERLSFQLGQDEVQLLRLSALLHDVGHGAFSHLSEPLLIEKTGKNHEQLGIEKIKSGKIGEEIEKAGYSISELEKIMSGKDSRGMIVHSDLGTDRMDYLLRDAYFCGVAYSVIDAERLLETLQFRDGELLVGEKGRLAAESLLVSRYLMFNSVYFHHAVRIAQEMCKKAIRSSLEKGDIKLEDITEEDDAFLLNKMLKAKNPLARCLSERRLFKRAFVLDSSLPQHAEFFGDGARALKKTESAVSKGCGEGEFIVSMPAVHSRPIDFKLLDEGGEAHPLKKTSAIARAVEREKKEDELIIACAAENADAVAKKAASLFG